MKKVLKYFVILGLLSIMIVLFVTRSVSIKNSLSGFFNSIYQNVEYVEVHGNNIVSTEDIISALYNLNAYDQFILKARDGILESLKNIQVIDNVYLKYSLPSKLTITVHERNPIFFYHTEYQNPVIVDSNFQEFFDKRVNLKELVYIRGEYNQKIIKDIFHELQQYPLIYENLTEIENFYNYRVNIVLNNKIFVILPEKDRDKALLLLEKYIRKYNLLKTNVYRVDFRNANKIFFAVNKDVTKYTPEQNKYVIYRAESRKDKYQKIIDDAISKI